MKGFAAHALYGLVCASAVIASFNVLEHLGGNSPWHPDPNVNHISADVPSECKVDQAVYVVRHGSRYPDQSAYQGWLAFQTKLQSANYTAHGDLSFIHDWKPVLDHPAQEIAQVSPGGYKELYALGGELRTRYPGFYQYGSPYLLWANDYPRVIDSARLFARGYIGPNSSLADVHVINASAPSAVGNSLSTSDSCPNFFKDTSGGNLTTVWGNVYLPPIVKRLNALIDGGFKLNSSDLTNIPYLCGYETQITGHRSPWCDVFREQEILDYEYQQDLRYYYGTGPGALKNDSVQLPLLQGIVDLLKTGPGVKAKTSNGSVTLPPLVMAFSQDNQINELVSITGIFDQQRPLSATSRNDSRIYISSNITPMRGTIAFERLNCGSNINVRIRLNDAVFPVPSCTSGPGKSCPLSQYQQLVDSKWKTGGSFGSVCNLTAGSVVQAPSGGVTFFTDLTLPAMRIVKP
ncbi:multiple inositol polyphosphate phosphatase [Myriangium duriaei CBS 260.36]|uniref:3-phytase n=1 Tax=Myriangium duriaei CBS 260.36 TaxID=1168546 RepID=A0A9P4J4L7_9PEZI|nr:multiple inositol polyphosphate phosphatase [Myriangium duriaei CBS 260.36]